MIATNKDVWVAVMMAEEHQLTPVSRAHVLHSALVVGISAVVGSLIPLLPFMVLPIAISMWTAVAALVLFAVGAYRRG